MAKKLTIEEKRKNLEEQLAELEVLGEVEEEINDLIRQYEENIKSSLTETYQEGLEPEQDKTWRGELRWQISDDMAKQITPDDNWPRTVYTEKELSDAGYTLEQAKAEPYYAPHYEHRTITFEEADSWTKERVRKYRKLVEILKAVEIA